MLALTDAALARTAASPTAFANGSKGWLLARISSCSHVRQSQDGTVGATKWPCLMKVWLRQGDSRPALVMFRSHAWLAVRPFGEDVTAQQNQVARVVIGYRSTINVCTLSHELAHQIEPTPDPKLLQSGPCCIPSGTEEPP
jgi:hypothetical protein